MIPLSVPNFEGNELTYVTKAVAEGWVSTGGAYIREMEQKLAAYLDVPGAAAMQSGTAALHLALRECGVQPGDLVIAPTLTFIAAVNPITYLGAEPVFMDCDASLCMDPEKLEAFCTEECVLQESRLVHRATGKTVRALVVVHVFGNMADMERILDIAATHHLKVVEDATEALGTRYTDGHFAGRYAGTMGDLGAFSFNGNKIITTGGGGMLVARDPQHLAHAAYASTQSKDDPLFYIHDEIGYNYRMTNVQAAIGVAQLEWLDTFIDRKNRNYDRYAALFAADPDVRLMPFREGTASNKWFYALYLRKETDIRRLVQELGEQGIQTRPIWGLIHEQMPYRHCLSYRIEQAAHYSRRILNIPCSTNLTEQEIQTVYEKVMGTLRR